MDDTTQRRVRVHRRTTEEIRGSEEATCAELGRLFHCGQEFFKAGFDAGHIAGHWEGLATRRPRRKLNVASARAYRRAVFPQQGSGQEKGLVHAEARRPSASRRTAQTSQRAAMKAFRAREAEREKRGALIAASN